jgi:hypothetical protein
MVNSPFLEEVRTIRGAKEQRRLQRPLQPTQPSVLLVEEPLSTFRFSIFTMVVPQRNVQIQRRHGQYSEQVQRKQLLPIQFKLQMGTERCSF